MQNVLLKKYSTVLITIRSGNRNTTYILLEEVRIYINNVKKLAFPNYDSVNSEIWMLTIAISIWIL